eukprot:CAMPEP_0171577004 /NCGR_PEP_ID=MMETSP0961-20121227/6962_1 /TAXON_ID=87120 /ORGANISM="Aurantiochytrium limacinum, Strain ATCCMYA-1381" /LENGTH=68 /DNA_ID=CAMNT_0012132963 /DNA_START=393 /DNA_END=599 /DNA_ORIENTATION=-
MAGGLDAQCWWVSQLKKSIAAQESASSSIMIEAPREDQSDHDPAGRRASVAHRSKRTETQRNSTHARS